LELIKFYCKILGKIDFMTYFIEKGINNTNPITVKTGGREAFLQDIEKLKNA